MSPRARLLSLALLLGGGCAAPASASARPPASLGLTGLSEELETLTEKVEPAVVQIFTTGYAPVSGAGGPTLEARQATGSGVLIRADGQILTNAHVVQGAEQVLISLARRMPDEARSVLKARGDLVTAEVLGVDLETDLALLDIEGSGYPFLELGDSEALRPGQLVLAFGSPRGLDGSVSMGVVSTVARQLRPEAPMIYIQTDAPINPGNSGGPMVDVRGKVVGINTLIVSSGGGSEGLGFAVPSHIARTVVAHLRSYGRVRRGVIGVDTQTIDPVLARGLGLSQSFGVIVSDVYPGLPAARAGLKPGDIVLALNGKRMENARQFDVNIYHQPFGRSVELDVLRDGETRRFGVIVVERPALLDQPGLRVDPEKDHVEALGVLAVDVDKLPRALKGRLRSPAGVVVLAGASGDAVKGGLRPGDVIRAVNLLSVKDVRQLTQHIDALEPGDSVVLQVERNQRLRFLSFLL